MSAQQGPLRKNAVVNSMLMIAFFVILRSLVSLTKRVAEAEVNASIADADPGVHTRFVTLIVLQTFLTVMDGVCLGFLLCRFLGNSFRMSCVGHVPVLGFLVYRTYSPARVLFLVYLSHRCTSSDGSYACPMSYSWDYLESFSQLSKYYVTDLYFVAFFQTAVVFYIICVDLAGNWMSKRHSGLTAEDASYEAVDTSEIDTSEKADVSV